METQAALSVIAEIAIAIAGFSTIAAAISRRSESTSTAKTWIQFRILLQTSMGITLLAYIPMVVGQIFSNANKVWVISSAIYAIYVIVAFVWLRHDLRNETGKFWTDRPAIIMQAVAAVDVSLHAVNILYVQTSWPYLAGLGCGTAIAMIQFFVLLRGFWWAAK